MFVANGAANTSERNPAALFERVKVELVNRGLQPGQIDRLLSLRSDKTLSKVQELIGSNLADPGPRAQLAAITTSGLNATLQKAFDDLVAQGATYQVVEPATYHPFVLYGEGYRDGFRTVGDCFVEAAAYLDSAGTPLAGETLSRASKGFRWQQHSTI